MYVSFVCYGVSLKHCILNIIWHWDVAAWMLGWCSGDVRLLNVNSDITTLDLRYIDYVLFKNGENNYSPWFASHSHADTIMGVSNQIFPIYFLTLSVWANYRKRHRSNLMAACQLSALFSLIYRKYWFCGVILTVDISGINLMILYEDKNFSYFY